MEEAVSGVKGELAIKLYGDDLKTLEEKGDEVVERDAKDSRASKIWDCLACLGSQI